MLWLDLLSSGLCIQTHHDGSRSQVFGRVGSLLAKAEMGQVLCRAEQPVVPNVPSWEKSPSWVLSHGAELCGGSRLQHKGWKSHGFGLDSSLSDDGGVVPSLSPAMLCQMN